MASRSIKLQVRIEPSQARLLSEITRLTGRSRSDIARLALDRLSISDIPAEWLPVPRTARPFADEQRLQSIRQAILTCQQTMQSLRQEIERLTAPTEGQDDD